MNSVLNASAKLTKSATPEKKKNWIFVAQLNDGRYIVGQHTNPSRRLAAINSGYNKAVEALSIYRIVGVREVTAERNLMSVTKKLCDRYSNDHILTL